MSPFFLNGNRLASIDRLIMIVKHANHVYYYTLLHIIFIQKLKITVNTHLSVLLRIFATRPPVPKNDARHAWRRAWRRFASFVLEVYNRQKYALTGIFHYNLL